MIRPMRTHPTSPPHNPTMNIPTVFVSSVGYGHHSLPLRWEIAHILNAEGILTEFANDVQQVNNNCPIELLIEQNEYNNGYVRVRNRRTKKEVTVPSHTIIQYLHTFVRSGAP